MTDAIPKNVGGLALKAADGPSLFNHLPDFNLAKIVDPFGIHHGDQTSVLQSNWNRNSNIIRFCWNYWVKKLIQAVKKTEKNFNVTMW